MSELTWDIMTRCMKSEFDRLSSESAFLVSRMGSKSVRSYKTFLSNVDELRVFIAADLEVIGMHHAFESIASAFVNSCNKVTFLLLRGSVDFPNTPDIDSYLREVFVGEMLSHESVRLLVAAAKMTVSPESPGCLHIVFKVLASESESENFKRVVSRAGDGQYAYGYRL